MIAAFYGPFHRMVDTAIETQSDKVWQARVLGADPKSGRTVKPRIGRYGPIVEIEGEGEEKPRFASLKKGQLIESITLDEALARFRPEEKVFVIGGAQIYAQALPLCDEFYLTRVFHAYQGDTCFPRWDEREWEIIDSESFASGKEFPYPFAFEHYRRRK